jgi:hypothetical protein
MLLILDGPEQQYYNHYKNPLFIRFHNDLSLSRLARIVNKLDDINYVRRCRDAQYSLGDGAFILIIIILFVFSSSFIIFNKNKRTHDSSTSTVRLTLRERYNITVTFMDKSIPLRLERRSAA